MTSFKIKLTDGDLTLSVTVEAETIEEAVMGTITSNRHSNFELIAIEKVS